MSRTRGALNRKTRAALHAVKECQLDANGLSTPVRYLLGIVNNPDKPEALRMQAARDVAPYLQPKLSAVDLNANKPPDSESEEQLLTKLADLIQKYPQLVDKLKPITH